MRALLWLAGPTLFLAAQLIAPQGSADTTARVEIMRQNSAAWLLSHQLFLPAFSAGAAWIAAAFQRAGGSVAAAIGALLTAFAILADQAIATEQLLALALATGPMAAQASSIIDAWRALPGFTALVFVPYLAGFGAGMPVLALAFKRAGVGVAACLPVAACGPLIALGGMFGLKPLLIAGALAWLIGSAWVQRSSEDQASAPGRPSA